MNSVKDIILSKDVSIKQSLEILNTTKLLILFVVNNKGVLVRTITDGDIRRFILDQGLLDDSVDKLPSKSPIVVTNKVLDSEVALLMYRNGINHIPVVDKHGRPIGLHTKKSIDNKILLSVPHMTGEEQEFIFQAFETNWISPVGPNIDAFENELSQIIGGSQVVALNTGTSAIHLALRLLDVTFDDFVFCQSLTFVASANPILYQHATPVFIDSEPETWNMSPKALGDALKYFKKNKKLPKAIIVVHLYGQSADMEEIIKISDSYGVPVIEDAAESLGSLYRGKHTGTFGKFGIFSFNGNKIITTSGGGALVSNDESMIERAKFLSTQAKDPKPYYQHTEVGYNYRMSNVLAGIGRGQLKVLDDRIDKRRKVFKAYQKKLTGISAIDWMQEEKSNFSNRWLSVFTINPDKSNITVKKLIDSLLELNIEARNVWMPMHMQPLFKDCLFFKHEGKDVGGYFFKTGVCLPSSSNLSDVQQNIVIREIIKIFDIE